MTHSLDTICSWELRAIELFSRDFIEVTNVLIKAQRTTLTFVLFDCADEILDELTLDITYNRRGLLDIDNLIKTAVNMYAQRKFPISDIPSTDPFLQCFCELKILESLCKKINETAVIESVGLDGVYYQLNGCKYHYAKDWQNGVQLTDFIDWFKEKEIENLDNILKRAVERLNQFREIQTPAVILANEYEHISNVATKLKTLTVYGQD